MNSVARTTLAITTIVIAKILFAVVGLAKLYEPSAEVLVGVQIILVTVLSAVSAVTRRDERRQRVNQHLAISVTSCWLTA